MKNIFGAWHTRWLVSMAALILVAALCTGCIIREENRSREIAKTDGRNEAGEITKTTGNKDVEKDVAMKDYIFGWLYNPSFKERFNSTAYKSMTLNDVRKLADKGDELIFEDFLIYRGANASSSMNYYLMVYGVKGGYRLVVASDGSGKPHRASLENIWENGESGIDIRYNSIDEFLNTHPSQDALSEAQAKLIAQQQLGLKLVSVSWLIIGEQPVDAADDLAFAELLLDSVDSIGEPCWVLRVKDTAEWGGQYYAVGKKSSTVFVCDISDKQKPRWDRI